MGKKGFDSLAVKLYFIGHFIWLIWNQLIASYLGSDYALEMKRLIYVPSGPSEYEGS